MQGAIALAASVIICSLVLSRAYASGGDEPDQGEKRDAEFLSLAQEIAAMGVAGDDVVEALHGR